MPLMRALALLCLVAFSAGAQEAPLSAPPGPPPEEQTPAPEPQAAPALAPTPVYPPPQPIPYEAPTLGQRCFAVPARLYVEPPRLGVVIDGSLPSVGGTGGAGAGTGGGTAHGAQPAKSGGSSGSSSGGGGGGLDGKAILVLAVVLVAALPIVIYAFDDEATPLVRQRFECPSFRFDLVGGAEFGQVSTSGFGAGRFTFGVGYGPC